MTLGAKRTKMPLKKNQIDTVVRKAPESTPKKTTDNVNTMAKKTDPNKEKISQQNSDPSCPSTSTSGPEKILFAKVPNQIQQNKHVK